MSDRVGKIIDRLLIGNAAGLAACISLVPTTIDHPFLRPMVIWPALAFIVGLMAGILAVGTQFVESEYPDRVRPGTAKSMTSTALWVMTATILGGLLFAVGATGYLSV